jgi:hypothetical protein
MSNPKSISEEQLILAANWMNDYIESQEEIKLTCVIEGMTDEQWEEHVLFVAECMIAGVKPTHFIDVLIKAQQDYNFDADAEFDD